MLSLTFTIIRLPLRPVAWSGLVYLKDVGVFLLLLRLHRLFKAMPFLRLPCFIYEELSLLVSLKYIHMSSNAIYFCQCVCHLMQMGLRLLSTIFVFPWLLSGSHTLEITLTSSLGWGVPPNQFFAKGCSLGVVSPTSSTFSVSRVYDFLGFV